MTPLLTLAAAAILHNAPCLVLDTDGVSLLDGTGHIVTTTQHATVECTAQTDGTGARLQFDAASTGETCVTGLGETTDWVEVISRDGRVVLRCRY